MNALTTLLAERELTGEALALLPDLGPCELVEGKVVPMSPTNWKHGRCVNELARLLGNYVKAHGLGAVLSGEVGIYTRRDPDTVRGADVAFISHERLAQVRSESYLDVAPELIIEVVSPGNTWQEMREKIDEYFGVGVEQVWLIEPAPRQARVYRAPTDVRVLSDEDAIEGAGVLHGFRLPLGELFGRQG